MESQPSFEQLIKEDRATRDSKKWRGTLLEYLELVRTDPSGSVTRAALCQSSDLLFSLSIRSLFIREQRLLSSLLK